VGLPQGSFTYNTQNLVLLKIRTNTKIHVESSLLEFIYVNPLCILNNANFNIVDISIENEFINILNGY